MDALRASQINMLTQLATLKNRLGIDDADVKDDVILTMAIEAFTARFDGECKRTMQRTVDAEEEFSADQREIIPACYPIEQVTAFYVEYNEIEGWLEQTDIVHLIRKKHIISLGSPFGTEDAIAKVVYTGGYVMPGDEVGDGQTALPKDVENACIEQCSYWYQNRKRLGLVAISGEGGSIQQFAQLDLLPSIKPVLKKYERFLL